MADGDDVQFITPTNRLRMKVGSGDGPMKVDPEAIKRAEQALETLSDEFDDWLSENLQQLRDTFSEVRVEGGDTEEKRLAFFTAAHDLKGLGSTLGYPLVTRISGSLSYFIHEVDGPLSPHMQTLVGHVDALAAVVGNSVQDEADAVGAQLAGELEELVRKALSE